MLHQVISGGQTGADQAGLTAAARFGIATGGWMPRGFRTEDGPNPELAETFGLQEHPSSDYAERTAANVRDSDGTIRIAGTFHSLGERCTLKCVLQQSKPYIDVDIRDPRPRTELVAEVIDWIHRHEIRVLNVAGNRRPTTRTAKSWGVKEFAVDFLCRVFRSLGHHESLSSPNASN